VNLAFINGRPDSPGSDIENILGQLIENVVVFLSFYTDSHIFFTRRYRTEDMCPVIGAVFRAK
jgi:hypothetical protein